MLSYRSTLNMLAQNGASCLVVCLNTSEYCREMPTSQTTDQSIALQEETIYRGSYMSTHVLLNLSNELGKRENARLAEHFIVFFAMSLIYSIKHEHE